MTKDIHLLLVFLFSIAALLYGIIRLKINPFLALLACSILTGILSQMPLNTIAKQLSIGFGQTLGGIGIVIGLGIIFGKILSEARATQQIAAMLLQGVGKKSSLLAINLTGFLASIPVFFDAAFVIFMPLLRDLSKKTAIPLISFVTAMAIGLISTHNLVIPTPGPLAVMGSLQLNPGYFILFAILVALPASIVGGLLVGSFLGRKSKGDILIEPDEEKELNNKVDSPSGILSFVVLLFPILLILVGSITSQFLPADSYSRDIVAFFGDKNVAMLIGVIIAFIAMRPFVRKSFDQMVTESAADAGPILLITGAGGAFGSIISASGISNYLVQALSSLNLSLLILGFLLSAILRAAQGSATVALVTTSSILAPMVIPAGANPLTVGLAICCGGMCCSFPNDSGFWVVSRFGKLTVPQTLRAWTLASTIGGIVGLLVTILIDIFIKR